MSRRPGRARRGRPSRSTSGSSRGSRDVGAPRRGGSAPSAGTGAIDASRARGPSAARCHPCRPACGAGGSSVSLPRWRGQGGRLELTPLIALVVVGRIVLALVIGLAAGVHPARLAVLPEEHLLGERDLA